MHLLGYWEFVKFAIIVNILLLTQSILTLMMGVDKLQWETPLFNAPWKRNWNGTRIDGLPERYSLPSPYSFIPTYLQASLQNIEGCDAILGNVCSLNNSATDFAMASTCSCDEAENEFIAVQDGLCLRACMEHEKKCGEGG